MSNAERFVEWLDGSVEFAEDWHEVEERPGDPFLEIRCDKARAMLRVIRAAAKVRDFLRRHEKHLPSGCRDHADNLDTTLNDLPGGDALHAEETDGE